MKLTENLYQFSGSMFGTNSNTYAFDTPDGLIFIDAGFAEKQYQIMGWQQRADGLEHKKIGHVFITHSHFDHSGNGWLLQKEGARIYMSAQDGDAVSKGDSRVLEDLFGRQFHTFTPDVTVENGQQFCFGSLCLTILSHPGHTEGTISILAETEGRKILFPGDLFVLKPCTPKDELQVEPGWNGGPDYNETRNLKTLRKLTELPSLDMVAPGHGSVYFGDSRELFELLYRTAEGK